MVARAVGAPFVIGVDLGGTSTRAALVDRDGTIHARDEFETPETSEEDVLAALRAMGHEVRAGGRQGDAHSIWIGPDGMPYGVNDTRSADSKASVPGRLTSPPTGR